MDKFTTLNALIYDLLLEIRGAQLAHTEAITPVQIESWIHQYRAVLIKRELDKNRLIDPDYIQTIEDLSLTKSDNGDYATTELPNTVYRNSKPGFTWIGNADGDEYQYGTQQKSYWQQYRRYTADEPYVYLLNNCLYSNNSSNITVKGLFENPMEVIRLTSVDANGDEVYPIPVTMIPTLKELILKSELNTEIKTKSDDTNDSEHNIE